MCEKLQGQMHSAFNECGPEGTRVVKLVRLFCSLFPDSFAAPLNCDVPLNFSGGLAGHMQMQQHCGNGIDEPH